LWTSGGGPVIGWLDTKVFDETGDAAKAQGWTALVVDTNGNGKRDAYVEPNQAVDPQKDKRLEGGVYAIMPSPVDRSVWGTTFGMKGTIVRLDPGANPPETALTEVYNVPAPGFAPRGADIDSKGVVWVSLGSGHLGSFDRRKCKAPLNGPNATGDQCQEGWSFHQYPGPGFLPASATTVPRPRITPGLISTIHWGWAMTCRYRPATKMTHYWRWSTANGWYCACPTR